MCAPVERTVGATVLFHRLEKVVVSLRIPRLFARSHVEERLFSSRRGCYLMKADATAIDCATLLAARRGFAEH